MARYEVYGLSVESDLPLPCPPGAPAAAADTVIVAAAGGELAGLAAPRGPRGRFAHVRRPDGADHVVWPGLFEFLVSPDGRRIACRRLAGAPDGVLQTYLLGHVLSFALARLGVESLHATAAVVGGGAAAFVGDCGYGKSSLGAEFLRAGHPLLTDDLLVVRESAGRFESAPGPPRIKLFPETARAVLGPRARGRRMNAGTAKLVIPLGAAGRWWPRPASLRAVYVLPPPARRGTRVALRALAPRAALLALLAATFNALVRDPARLARQLDVLARLAAAVPVKRLSCPGTLDGLPAVRAAIERDLAA